MNTCTKSTSCLQGRRDRLWLHMAILWVDAWRVMQLRDCERPASTRREREAEMAVLDFCSCCVAIYWEENISSAMRIIISKAHGRVNGSHSWKMYWMGKLYSCGSFILYGVAFSYMQKLVDTVRLTNAPTKTRESKQWIMQRVIRGAHQADWCKEKTWCLSVGVSCYGGSTRWVPVWGKIQVQDSHQLPFPFQAMVEAATVVALSPKEWEGAPSLSCQYYHHCLLLLLLQWPENPGRPAAGSSS